MPAKIIVKRYGDHSTVWLSQQFLTEKTGICDRHFRTHARQYFKKNGHTWRYEKRGDGFYYDYERLPDRYKPLLGSKSELIGLSAEAMPQAEVMKAGKANILKIYESYGTARAQAANWYAHNCHARQAVELAQSWCWARLVSDYTNKNNRLWIRLGLEKIMDVYACVVEILTETAVKGLKVSSATALYNKLKGFSALDLEGQYRLFIHKNEGNDHHSRLNSETEDLIIYLRGHERNWSGDNIVRKIRLYCALQGWHVPSERLVERVLEDKRTQVITEQGRYGKRSNRLSHTNGVLNLARPVFAGDCWQMDVTRVNFEAHMGEDGRPRYLRHCVVYDVYSGAVLGRSYAISEHHLMYVQALRQAYMTAGYLPYELVHDRFPGHDTEQWKHLSQSLKSHGVKVSVSSFATGKAQLERFFGTLQSVFMSDSLFYYGEGVRSTRAYAHRSEDYRKKAATLIRRSGWDFSGACAEADAVLQRYNDTPKSVYSKKYKDLTQSPLSLHAESDKPHTIQIETHRAALLFSLKKTLKVGAAGMLKMTVSGQDLYYRLDDMRVAMSHHEALICYDVENLRQVLAFDARERYLCTATEVTDIQVYGPHAQQGRLSTERAKNKLFAQKAWEEYMQVSDRVHRQLQEQGIDESKILNPLTTPKSELEKAEDQAAKALGDAIRALPEAEASVPAPVEDEDPFQELWGV